MDIIIQILINMDADISVNLKYGPDGKLKHFLCNKVTVKIIIMPQIISC